MSSSGIPGFSPDQLPTGTEEEQARKPAEPPTPPPQPVQEPPKVVVGTEVVLPSRGLPYGGKIPDGKVTVMPMTFSAEKLIATGPQDLSLTDVLLPAYVRGIQSLDSHHELALNDQVYLLWCIRAETWGPLYEFQPRCPGCQKRSIQKVNMPDDVDLHMAPEGWHEPVIAKLPYCQGTAEIRSLRGTDEAKITRLREKKLRDVDVKTSGDPGYTYRMVQQIVKLAVPPRPSLPEGVTVVNNSDEAAERLYSLVDSLHSRDIAAIRTAAEDNDFGLNARREFTCPHCGRGFEDLVRPEAEFFRPPRQRGGGTSSTPL